MAEKLKKAFDAPVDLVKGSNGIFNVEQEEKLVYSKHKTGEFPDEETLINEIKSNYSMG